MGHHLHKGLHMRIPYTGRILVGDDYISKYYIHMGYQRAWAYKELRELVFEEGFLVEKTDHSHIAEKLRQEIDANIESSSNETRNIAAFIVNSFSLEYKDKAWWL